jgi:cobyrinic acid a,c-diamide synthase
MAPAAGIVVAAPASRSGKTVITSGLIRALVRQGVRVAPLKVGPDYIDPAFLAAAAGRPCRNLDLWAMRPETAARIVADAGLEAELIVVEGVMGLFDGAAIEAGSTADLAASNGWPVILVADVRGQGASVAALADGFRRHRHDVTVAGVILNRVGSERHEAILRRALGRVGMPVLGAVPAQAALALPERHLGLVQAGERADLDRFLDGAADVMARHLDLGGLRDLARPARAGDASGDDGIAPLGQRIAVARDTAFAFSYPAMLDGWRRAGAEMAFFSPLADEAPAADADAVFLPGGYPELHGGRLAANAIFLGGLRAAAGRGAAIYGECGGYMVLGRGLTDADGHDHALAGLLPLESSFAVRQLHLGYRQARLETACMLGGRGQRFRGHEFHYATITSEGEGQALFSCRDSAGRELGRAGRRHGGVCGSFIHLIDRAAG